MRYKGSIAVEEVNGSAGGVTGARAAGVKYLKNKPFPSNPRTTAQSRVRGSFAECARAFKGLSFDKAQEWNQAAKGVYGRSVLGEKATLSGINLFVRTNQNILEAGGALVTDVPSQSATALPLLNMLGIAAYQAVETSEGSTAQVPVPMLDSFTAEQNIRIIVKMAWPIDGNRSNVRSQLRVVESNATLVQIAADAEGNTVGKAVTLLKLDYWKSVARDSLPYGEGVRMAFEVYAINSLTGERTAGAYYEGESKAYVAREPYSE